MVKKIILITISAVILVGIITAGITFTMDDYYTAAAYLVMTPVPLSSKDYVPSILSEREDIPYRVSFLTLNDVPTFPMPDYEEIYTSSEIIEKLVQLLSQKEEYKDIELSRTSLRKSLSIKSKIFFQGTNQVQYQRIIQLQFTGKDPNLAADICNYWVDLGMAKIEELRLEPLQEGIEYLEKTLSQKKAELESKREGLEQLEASYHLPSLEARIQELENQITSFRIQQVNLALETEQLAKEIELTSSEPAERTPIPDGENENHNANGVNIKTLKNELALKTNEKEAIQKQMAELEKEIAQLRQLYAEKNRQKNTLENEQIQLKQIVENLNISYQNALASIEKSQCELRVASKALPPHQKTGPPRTRYILAVIILTAVAVPTIYIGLLITNYYLNKFEKELSLPS